MILHNAIEDRVGWYNHDKKHWENSSEQSTQHMQYNIL